MVVMLYYTTFGANTVPKHHVFDAVNIKSGDKLSSNHPAKK